MRENEYELPSTGKIIGLIPFFGQTIPRELPWHHHRTMSDIILAFSGHHIQRIVIIKPRWWTTKVLWALLQVPLLKLINLVSAIASLVSIEPVLVHNTLYYLLDDDIVAVGIIPKLYKSLPCLYLLHSGCPSRPSSYLQYWSCYSDTRNSPSSRKLSWSSILVGRSSS